MIEIRSAEPRTFGRVLMRVEVASRVEEKTPLISQVLQLLRDERFLDDEEEMQVRLCLDEAILNAMKHGNKFDEAKVVRITLLGDTNRWAIRIQDQGEGFEPRDVPDVNDPESLLLEGGRGILLMVEFMDEVWYYDGGRAVQLEKARVTLGRRIRRRLGRWLRRVKRWLRLG